MGAVLSLACFCLAGACLLAASALLVASLRGDGIAFVVPGVIIGGSIVALGMLVVGTLLGVAGWSLWQHA